MMPWSFGDHDGLSFALCATCSVLHQRSFKEDGTDYGFSRHGPLNILQTYSKLKYQSQAIIGCLHRPRLHLLHNLFAFSGLHECLLQISFSIGKLGFAWAMPVVCWPRPSHLSSTPHQVSFLPPLHLPKLLTPTPHTYRHVVFYFQHPAHKVWFLHSSAVGKSRSCSSSQPPQLSSSMAQRVHLAHSHSHHTHPMLEKGSIFLSISERVHKRRSVLQHGLHSLAFS